MKQSRLKRSIALKNKVALNKILRLRMDKYNFSVK